MKSGGTLLNSSHHQISVGIINTNDMNSNKMAQLLAFMKIQCVDVLCLTDTRHSRKASKAHSKMSDESWDQMLMYVPADTYRESKHCPAGEGKLSRVVNMLVVSCSSLTITGVTKYYILKVTQRAWES